MCGKFLRFTHDETLALIDCIEDGELVAMSRVFDDADAITCPQSSAPLVIAQFDTSRGVASLSPGSLAAHDLCWGFEESWRPGVVFNTRIESADKPTWADSMLHRRCAVPVSAFFETHRSETFASPKTGRPVKRQFEFRVPGHDAILIGCVWKGDRFSMVTTEANESMAPIHDRMPLIVRPEELVTWLGPEYRTLANRDSIKLDAEPVTPVGGTPSLF